MQWNRFKYPSIAIDNYFFGSVQDAAEKYLVSVFAGGALIAEAAGRKTLKVEDIQTCEEIKSLVPVVLKKNLVVFENSRFPKFSCKLRKSTAYPGIAKATPPPQKKRILTLSDGSSRKRAK